MPGPFSPSKKILGSFDAYLWSFVGGKRNRIAGEQWPQVPARTDQSDAMSRDLLKRGFKFVGCNICYALMQATGMVDDHLVTCPRYAELGVKKARRTARRKLQAPLRNVTLLPRPRRSRAKEVR